MGKLMVGFIELGSASELEFNYNIFDIYLIAILKINLGYNNIFNHSSVFNSLQSNLIICLVGILDLMTSVV